MVSRIEFDLGKERGIPETGMVDTRRWEWETNVKQIIEDYRPWEQVKANVMAGRGQSVLEITDSYRPWVQQGKGDKLKQERIPGSDDSYIVGVLDGRVPGASLREGYGWADNSLMWASQFNYEGGDKSMISVQMGHTIPPLNEEMKHRMGISRSVWGNTLVAGREVKLVDMPYDHGQFHINIGVSEGSKQAIEIGYSAILLAHYAEFLNQMDIGDKIFMEVVTGETSRHIAAVEKSKTGINVWGKPRNLEPMVANHLGLGEWVFKGADERLRNNVYLSIDELVEVAAKRLGATAEETKDALMWVRVKIADDRDSIGPARLDWKYAINDNEVEYHRYEYGQQTQKLTAPVEEVVRLWTRILEHNKRLDEHRTPFIEDELVNVGFNEMKISGVNLDNLFLSDGSPAELWLWRELGKSPNNEADVRLMKFFAHFSRDFISGIGAYITTRDKKEVIKALLKEKKKLGI